MRSMHAALIFETLPGSRRTVFPPSIQVTIHGTRDCRYMLALHRDLLVKYCNTRRGMVSLLRRQTLYTKGGNISQIVFSIGIELHVHGSYRINDDYILVDAAKRACTHRICKY